MSGTRYGTIAIHDSDDDVDDDKSVAAAAVEGGYYQHHHHEGAPLLKQPEGGDLQQSSSSSSTSKVSSSLLIGEYWSHLTFSWITPLLARGNSEEQLYISDLRDWSLPTNCQTEEVYAVFRRCWEEELCRVRANDNSNTNGNTGNDAVDHKEKQESSLEKKNGSSKGEANAKEGDEATLLMDGLFDTTSSSSKHQQQQPSLIWTLYKSFGTEFINAGYLKLIHDACLFVGPQVLNRLIHFVRTPEYTLTYGLGLVAAGEL